MNKILSLSLAVLLLLAVSLSVARAGPSQSIEKPPSKEIPPLPDYLPEKPPEAFTLPPPPQRFLSAPGNSAFTLNGVTFDGNTVFSDQELERVAEPFMSTRVSVADLEEIRYRLTRYYVDRGYPNSGALIKPGQHVDNGIIAFVIKEGRLGEINVSNAGRLRPGYIQKRIWPDENAVFSTDLLQEKFQMLLQDPLIKRMNGRILPGPDPGDALLDLSVTREKPYSFKLISDNRSPPSLGGERLLANAAVHNLTGLGDSLDLTFGLTEGTNELNVAFSVPLNYHDTMLVLGYKRSSNSVIEEPLDSLDVESRLESAMLSLNHPVFHNLQQRLDLGIVLELQESRTFLFDMPFSFSEGYEDGKSTVTALRLVQSFQERSRNHAIFLRSTLSVGLNLFGATIHSDGRTDGKFTSWLGQVQYAFRFGERIGQMIFRGGVQLSDDHLLSMEQLSAGGASTVRGYRENELVRDNGYDLSLEWRIPIWKRTASDGRGYLLEIAPFIDHGSAWNKNEQMNDHRLFSSGAGILWTSPGIEAGIYLAHAFEDGTDSTDHDLQDEGIHFSVTITLL